MNTHTTRAPRYTQLSSAQLLLSAPPLKDLRAQKRTQWRVVTPSKARLRRAFSVIQNCQRVRRWTKRTSYIEWDLRGLHRIGRQVQCLCRVREDDAEWEIPGRYHCDRALLTELRQLRATPDAPNFPCSRSQAKSVRMEKIEKKGSMQNIIRYYDCVVNFGTKYIVPYRRLAHTYLARMRFGEAKDSES